MMNTSAFSVHPAISRIGARNTASPMPNTSSGAISHGIKVVLTGLDASVYFLNSGLNKGNQDRLQEGLDTVKLMAERIRNVIMNILYYAKGRELNWERVDVLTLLMESVGIVEPKINGKPIRIERDSQDDIGHIETDSLLMRAAAINILGNAVKACLDDASKHAHLSIISLD